MDLKKKKDKISLLTAKGKLVFYSAFITGVLSYLLMSLLILGNFSNKMNEFLKVNFSIIGICFIFLISFIIASFASSDTDDLINKK